MLKSYYESIPSCNAHSPLFYEFLESLSTIRRSSFSEDGKPIELKVNDLAEITFFDDGEGPQKRRLCYVFGYDPDLALLLPLYVSGEIEDMPLVRTSSGLRSPNEKGRLTLDSSILMDDITHYISLLNERFRFKLNLNEKW